jgi:anti-anti-sigma regulatory factor
VVHLFNRRRSPRLLLPVTQPLVAGTVLAVEGAFAAALLNPRPNITLDLSLVDRCDTAGAALLHAFVALVNDGGGHVQIRGARPAVAAALRQAGTQQLSATAPVTVPVVR